LSLAVFNDTLYAGTLNFDTGGEIWRMSSPWSQVNDDGFGDSDNMIIAHLIEFKNYLYAGTGNDADGGEIWRSSNGTDWNQVASGGFGDTDNDEIFRFAIFNNQLDASTWDWSQSKGTEIWRSSSGDTGTWSQVNATGFGDTDNQCATVLEVFNGYLYAGTFNSDTGGEIWRTSVGTTWNQVNTDGFGDGNNHAASSFAVFNGYLYAGTENDTTGGQVWRCSTCDGSDWTQVVSNGFGSTNNRRAAALIASDNYLYCVTSNDETGAEVWHSSTGDSGDWEQVGPDGFGDSNNVSTNLDNAVAVFNDRLYASTSNWANGGQVWGGPLSTVVGPSTGSSIIYTDAQGLATTVEVPAGAVTETTTIVYSPILFPTNVAGGFQFAGQAFSLEAYRDGQALPDFDFETCVTITIRYDDTDVVGLNENALVLKYWNGTSWVDAEICDPPGYIRDVTGNVIQVLIPHLSDFALMGKSHDKIYLPIILKSFSP
jgi:hypothetical protein